MDLSRIEIFYDGMDILKYSTHKSVSGFTTNCSVFSKWSVKHYEDYYGQVSENLKGRSLSMQVWEDDIERARAQINGIYKINPSIFVKIPMINTLGAYNDELFIHAMSMKMNINITCLYTLEQIQHAHDLFKTYDSPIIVSVFAGPISDTGIDPSPFVTTAVSLFASKKNAKILWAGCREVYSIQRAINNGCHIITAPDSVIDKLNQLGKDLMIASVDRAKTFQQDAVRGQLII